MQVPRGDARHTRSPRDPRRAARRRCRSGWSHGLRGFVGLVPAALGPATVALPALALTVLAVPATLFAQDPARVPADTAGVQEREGPGGEALRVFVDCSGRFCDDDFFRREVPFVNYVRDRQDADVHVLITSQRTGAGGRSFTLDFIGRDGFAGMEDRQTIGTEPQLPEEEVLERLSRAIGLGLIRFVAQTGAADRIRISLEEEAGRPTVAQPGDDPWDFWVFRTSLRAGVEGEDRQNELSLSASVSANRVTEKLKLELSVDGRYEEENFEVDENTTVTRLQRDYEFEGLVVHSLGPHWSVGAQGEAEHATFSNRKLALRIAPALEYNLFRYEDSERKQFTLLYTIGLNSFDWREETIFGKTSETKLDQSLRASLAVRQPWGEAGGQLQAFHYLDDPSRNRFDARAFIRLRLVRGLSLDLSGDVSRVRDQINLPAGDATEEEILLEIRELQTGFEYDVSIGFSYTFGSIFNNVVNPRFSAGNGRRF